MRRFDEELLEELAGIRAEGLGRELRRVDSAQGPEIELDGRPVLNFASNDYLGLASHPSLRQAAAEAVARYGAGSGASRLICGSLAIHHELEAALAAFKNAPAALWFSSGYAAAIGTIGALVGRGDVIVMDRLVHACIVDAARLSGARLRVFDHNDMEDLARILAWSERFARHSEEGRRPGRVLVVTESVFSMDGDQAPLSEIVELKDRHGAWLLVDEAHATGLYGKKGQGLAAAMGLAERIEVQMGTLGKALGAAGGYICGAQSLIDLLVHRARSFVFSTAPVPAAAAAALAGIALAGGQVGEERRGTVWRRVNDLAERAGGSLAGLRASSAIIPVQIGDERRAVEVAARLRADGVYVPAIRYPTVGRGKARLRITVTASHSAEHVDALAAALGRALSA